MLVVRLELWPYGSQEMAENLGEIHIINDGSGSSVVGNYIAKFFQPIDSLHKFPNKEVTVKEWPRIYSAWELLHQILEKLYYDECNSEV